MNKNVTQMEMSAIHNRHSSHTTQRERERARERDDRLRLVSWITPTNLPKWCAELGQLFHHDKRNEVKNVAAFLQVSRMTKSGGCRSDAHTPRMRNFNKKQLKTLSLCLSVTHTHTHTQKHTHTHTHTKRTIFIICRYRKRHHFGWWRAFWVAV